MIQGVPFHLQLPVRREAPFSLSPRHQIGRRQTFDRNESEYLLPPKNLHRPIADWTNQPDEGFAKNIHSACESQQSVRVYDLSVLITCQLD